MPLKEPPRRDAEQDLEQEVQRLRSELEYAFALYRLAATFSGTNKLRRSSQDLQLDHQQLERAAALGARIADGV